MNEKEALFYQENEKMISDLISSLCIINKKFNEGIIPGNPEKENTIKLLENYRKALLEYKRDEISIKNKTVKKENIENKGNDENKVIEILTNNKEVIDLLIAFVLEKMIPIKDNRLKMDLNIQLEKMGIIEKVVVGVKKEIFWVLSKKGMLLFKNEKILKLMKDTSNNAYIPDKIIDDNYILSDYYVRQVVILNNYYRIKKMNASHFIFSFDDSKELLLACEIADSQKVTYVLAGVFDERIDSQISKIKKLISAGGIDSLKILYGSYNQRMFLEKNGLSSLNYSSIEFEEFTYGGSGDE